MSGRPYAEVIGDPIAHSKSPAIHGFWLAKLGIEAEYRACHVRAEELERYFTDRRGDAAWRGCNVTIPHKEAVLRLVDSVAPEAATVGAVNTVIRQPDGLIGHNTDVSGIREAFANIPAMPPPPNHIATQVEVIGAGGAARAAAVACRSFGDITFYNRTIDKARKLADEFMYPGADERAATLHDLPQDRFRFDPGYPAVKENRGDDQRYSYIVVNASSMGMNGQSDVPIDLDWYPQDTIVFDMVYAPLETGLLREARARGMRTIDGLAMLIGQAAAAFELFFGQPAPRRHDAELRALLTA
ncbi:MAG: shikimate dehydrogenase [Novosphingobium sp.]